MKTHTNLKDVVVSGTTQWSRLRKGIRNIALAILTGAAMAACGQIPITISHPTATDKPSVEQTYTPEEPTENHTYTRGEPTAEVTYAPTETATLEPTATNTPALVPLEGRLFFDMNGSGLRDEASFNYDAARLTDERQPLQADLLAAITAYINEHPELQDGDLITFEEPGLSNYTVCAKNICVATGSDGSFVLPGATQNSYLNITDPNAGTPAQEMRYINQWNKAVTVAAYTKDVDAATMGALTIVPGCEEDAEALVCKLDEDTLQVRDQHLNDTEILPLSKTAQVGKNGEIGLMQGFLTAPFPLEYPAYILGYFDIDGRYPWDKNGTSHNYLGETYSWTWGNPYSSTTSDKIDKSTLVFPGVTGTQDGHDALDIRLDLLTPVFATIDGTVSDIFSKGPEIKLVHIINGKEYITFYGHLDTDKLIVEKGQQVYRGQLIAFSSNTGDNNNLIPIIHFALIKTGLVNVADYTGDTLIDPFRNISGVDYPLASTVSSFTVDNFFVDSPNSNQ